LKVLEQVLNDITKGLLREMKCVQCEKEVDSQSMWLSYRNMQNYCNSCLGLKKE